MARTSSGVTMSRPSKSEREDKTFQRELETMALLWCHPGPNEKFGTPGSPYLGFSNFDAAWWNVRASVNDPKYLPRELREKWSTSGASCPVEPYIKLTIQRNLAECSCFDRDTIEGRLNMQTFLAGLDVGGFDVQRAWAMLNLSEQINRIVRLARMEVAAAKEEAKREKDSEPVASLYYQPVSLENITRLIPLEEMDPLFEGSEHLNTAQRRNWELAWSWEKYVAYRRHLKKLPGWEGDLLSTLPAMQWGSVKPPKFGHFEKGGQKKANVLGGVSMQHPFMMEFKAFRVIEKDGRVFIKGKERVQKGFIHRLVPIEDLSIDGVPLTAMLEVQGFYTNTWANETLFTGEENVLVDDTGDVYHHQKFGFVTIVRHDDLSGMTIVRELVPDERQLVGHKFDVNMELHGFLDDEEETSGKRCAVVPEDLGVHIVEPSELIPFKSFTELGVKSSELYAVYNLTLSDPDDGSLESGVIKGLDEFVYVLKDLPLQPKLDKTKLIAIRDINNELVYIEKDGVRQPALTHPQATAKRRVFDERIGTYVMRDVPLWESPKVLVIGENSGRVTAVPASWLYQVNSDDHSISATKRHFDKVKKKVVVETKTWGEKPAGTAWENRADFDDYSYTLLMKAHGQVGRPEGTWSILPLPVPGSTNATYRNEADSLPIRPFWYNAPKYKWENPNGRNTVVVDTDYAGPTGDILEDIEYSVNHQDDVWVDAGVAIIQEPSREEIMEAVNKKAWYWSMPPATPRSLGFSSPQVTFSQFPDKVASVTVQYNGESLTIDVVLTKPGELGVTADLTPEQAGYICRLVSYEAARVRVMARSA